MSYFNKSILVIATLFINSLFSSFCLAETKCAEFTVSYQNDMKCMHKISEGVRLKKIVFVKVKVYQAELYLPEGAPWKSGDAGLIDKLDANLPIQLKLNMLRSVDAKRIEDSFREGLKENDIDPGKAGYSDFLKAVLGSGEFKENGSVTLTGTKSAKGDEQIKWVGPDQKEVVLDVPVGTVKGLFSIWFGKPADSQLAKLKNELLGIKD